MYINSHILRAKAFARQAAESKTDDASISHYLTASKEYLDAAEEIDDAEVKSSLVFMSLSCTRMACLVRKGDVIVNVNRNINFSSDISDVIANERALFLTHNQRISKIKKVSS